MTDMQRWASPIGEMTEAVNGRYVLASDAEAAIRAAVEVVTERRVAAVGDIAKQVAEASERGRSKGYEEGYWTGAKSGYADGHKDGQRDMLAKCIALVDETYKESPLWLSDNEAHALSVDILRALQEKP
jgi:flagellar biosynthesis/type III secretory pathway protein FliH